MKKRLYSVLATGMLCTGMLFSALVPVHDVSAHGACEHMTPPELVEVEKGYGFNSTYHWMVYATVVKCRACGEVMEVVSFRDGAKEEHNKPSPSKPCTICWN